MPRSRIFYIIIILSGLCAVLYPIVVNLWTAALPENWKSYLWLTGLLVVIFGLGAVGLPALQFFLEGVSDTLPDAQARRNRNRMLEKVKSF